MTLEEAHKVKACMWCSRPDSTACFTLSNGNRVRYCHQCLGLEPVATSLVDAVEWDGKVAKWDAA